MSLQQALLCGLSRTIPGRAFLLLVGCSGPLHVAVFRYQQLSLRLWLVLLGVTNLGLAASPLYV
jgi:hypothetical protein